MSNHVVQNREAAVGVSEASRLFGTARGVKGSRPLASSMRKSFRINAWSAAREAWSSKLFRA